MKAYFALIKIDLKLALRQPSIIFFNYLFPMIFFFVFAQAYRADEGGVITQVVTMVAVIGILGNGLFGAGMRAVQERENNILRRYKVAPISAAPLLVASMVTGLLTYLPYLLLMLALAHFRYGMVFPQNIFSVLLFATFGLVAFRSLGLTVASVVNSMQESAIITQLLYFAMLFLSGASFPLTMFPKWLMTVTQFIPATYLMSGLQSIMLRKESILQNGPAVGALCLTCLVATFVSVKLFRWEKEEKIKTSAKLWLVAVLAPFIVMGVWQAHSQDNVVKARVLARELNQSRSILIRNARIFTGDGKVIETGSILIRGGKIAQIYEGTAPDAKLLKAVAIEGAGKTVLPGMIDVDVRLARSGGFSAEPQNEKQMQRELAEYLYCGITAVGSVDGPTDSVLKVRGAINSGERLGAELFFAEKGPNRGMEAISDAALTAMKQEHVPYVALLSAAEGPRPDELNRPLVLQTAPPELLAATRKGMVAVDKKGSLNIAKSNLLRAWQAGVTLVTGSGAGSPLVFHGPTLQRELELWIEAGIPPDVGLQAATRNAAQFLRADQRFGTIRPGMEATVMMVEGNPLTDIHATALISSVILKGERVTRSSLFEEE
jgi:ABC-type multidrug transport system permease subunit